MVKSFQGPLRISPSLHIHYEISDSVTDCIPDSCQKQQAKRREIIHYTHYQSIDAILEV